MKKVQRTNSKSLSSTNLDTEGKAKLKPNVSGVSIAATRRPKKSAKGKKKDHEKEETQTYVKKSSFDIPGVATLILSTLSQKVVGCLVGENVTAEEPWTYVKKELIEDNIELHEESSEFLSLWSELKVYSEPTVLMGWIPAASDKHDEFYIVYTKEAKEEVLQVIEKQKQAMQERLQRQVARLPGKWKSLGSEPEVNEERIQNFRPLYEIEINSDFPMYAKPITFEMRKVEDAQDGYVELLQDQRYPIESITKKRVDLGTQVAPLKIESEAQTTYSYPVNMSTQYEYNFEYEKEPEGPVIDEKSGLEKKIVKKPVTLANLDMVFDNVFVNQYVDIHKNDYAELLSEDRLRFDVSGNMHKFLTCSDQSSSKGRLVADVKWSYFQSGVLAVAYSGYCRTSLVKNIVKDEVQNALDGAPPVCIWTYIDGLEPILYLQTPREVTFISWCPYTRDILLGGTINGQLIIWDLTNKIAEVETPEFLTAEQKRNRLNLLSLMKWMQFTHKVSVVQPAVISDLKWSHKGPINSIQWFPQDGEVTKNGRFRIRDDVLMRQFASMSEDGSILHWDLDMKTAEVPGQTPTGRKLKRLKKIPSGLIAKESAFKELANQFKPHYRLTLTDLPIVSQLREVNHYVYNPIGPYDSDPKVRTEFYLVPNQKSHFSKPQYMMATTTGSIFNAIFEGFDFDMGTKINTEEAKPDFYDSIHDGPVTFMGRHPTYREYILTVGGKIFSIWHAEKKYPLLWRKAENNLKYKTGTWLLLRPSSFICIRSDGCMELWDLLVSVMAPIRKIGTEGDMIDDNFGGLSAMHPRKKTIAFSDNAGTLNLCHMPDLLTISNPKELKEITNLLERSYNRLEIVKAWIDLFEETYLTRADERSKIQIDSLLQVAAKKKHEMTKFVELEKMEKLFASVQWKTIKEKQMFETMLKRKRLNLKELAIYKRKLMLQDAEKKEKFHKERAVLQRKDDFFINESSKILARRKHLEHQRTYTVERDSEDITYIDDYDNIEESSLFFIKTHPYDVEFNWTKLLDKGTAMHKYVQDYWKLKHTPLDSKRRESLERKIIEPVKQKLMEKRPKFQLKPETSSEEVEAA